MGILPRVKEAGDIPEMLAGMEEINDLDGAGKMQIGEVPNPLRPIAHDYFLDGPVPAAILGFGIEPLAELLCGLDGSGVGSGVRVTNGEALLVIGSLGEDASQFHFSGTSGHTFDLTYSTFGLGNRDSCAIPLPIQARNRLAHQHRQT